MGDCSSWKRETIAYTTFHLLLTGAFSNGRQRLLVCSYPGQFFVDVFLDTFKSKLWVSEGTDGIFFSQEERSHNCLMSCPKTKPKQCGASSHSEKLSPRRIKISLSYRIPQSANWGSNHAVSMKQTPIQVGLSLRRDRKSVV